MISKYVPSVCVCPIGKGVCVCVHQCMYGFVCACVYERKSVFVCV